MKKLITLLAIICKLSWTNNSTTHAQEINPRPYTHTENGAKLALKYKIDAESFAFQLTQKDSVIIEKDKYITQQANQITSLQTAATFTEKTEKTLKRKLFWKSVEVWSWRITATAAIITVVIIQTKQ